MSDPNVFEPEWEPGTPPGMRGLRLGVAAGATELGMTVYELEPGAVLTTTAPGAGQVFPAEAEKPIMEALKTAMELDAAEDQRGTSTS